MSSSIPELSVLQCIHSRAPAESTKELTEWMIETDDAGSAPDPSFDSETGVYTVPKDGIYVIQVQVIPIGGPTLLNARRTRKVVNYALRIQDPLTEDEYLDVGVHNFGEMPHLRAGTTVSCLRMAGAPGGECVRLNISCAQRKRKREEVVLSKKEAKRRKRASTRNRVDRDATDEDVDSSDSEWEHGFDSDSSSDELPTSSRSVCRLAKRLKTVDAE